MFYESQDFKDLSSFHHRIFHYYLKRSEMRIVLDPSDNTIFRNIGVPYCRICEVPDFHQDVPQVFEMSKIPKNDLPRCTEIPKHDLPKCIEITTSPNILQRNFYYFAKVFKMYKDLLKIQGHPKFPRSHIFFEIPRC